MSLGIAFKGAEGIVLAADSRVTLLAQLQLGGNNVMTPATFDNATKLLSVQSQSHVAAVTYGVGAIGTTAPRTPASFIPEFDSEIAQQHKGRMTVEEFANALSAFFMRQWTASKMPTTTDDMVFLVAGYDDENVPYGRIYEIHVPNRPAPIELLGSGQFGAAWGGQRELTDRVLQGFDPQLPMLVQEHLNVPLADRQAKAGALATFLRDKLTIAIPWQFLPLQDCVDLSIFILRTTITLQKWLVGIRGVGGSIDLATITRADGFKPILQKKITGQQAIQ